MQRVSNVIVGIVIALIIAVVAIFGLTGTLDPPTPLDPTPTREIVLTPTLTPILVNERDCNRLGLNINAEGVRDWRQLLAHIEASDPCAVLIMNGLDRAQEIYDLLGGRTIVIHREYSRQEGSEWILTSPKTQVDRWAAEGHRDIVRYGGSNEPSYGSKTPFSALMVREIEMMRLARQAGITVSVGNFGIGRIQPQWVENGLLDDFLRALETYDHYLGIHEYTTLALPFGVGVWPRTCLENPDCVQPKNWPTREQVPTARWIAQIASQSFTEDFTTVPFGIEMLNSAYVGSGFNAQSVNNGYFTVIPPPSSDVEAQGALGTTLPPYWHLKRGDWLIIRAADIEVTLRGIILGESFFDHLDDINTEGNPILDMLEARWGLNEFMFDIRGIPSHCRLWEEFYFPQWSCDEAAFEQMVWADTVYSEIYLGFLTFTWSSNPNWNAFDITGRRELHRLMEGYAEAQPWRGRTLCC